MSVEFEAKLVYGFMVDSYMAEELYNRDRELFDEFTYDDYTTPLNGYVGPLENFYAFGLVEGWAEPGEAYEISVTRGYNAQHFLDMVDLFKKYFPNQREYIPYSYMCCVVY